jgi:hypothetical protein
VSTVRRALILTELGLAIDSEAVAAIVEVVTGVDAPADWLPARVFGSSVTTTTGRRALVLVDGERLGVPAVMHLAESIEVLAIPELLRTIAARGGITGLAVLPAGLALFCDPRRIAEARDDS